MLKQVHIYYSGDVQGVGFRYSARSVAQRLFLKGYAKNLPDGRVEVAAEGEENTLKEFLTEIREKMNYCHFTESLSWNEPSGLQGDFSIKF